MNNLRQEITKTIEMIAAGYVGEDGIDSVIESMLSALPKISSKSTDHDEGSGYRRYLEGQEDYQDSIIEILQSAKDNIS